jgi:hypothetical protein
MHKKPPELKKKLEKVVFKECRNAQQLKICGQ